MLNEAYIALGANLGDKVRAFNTALEQIKLRIGPILKVSKFYPSAPLNPPEIKSQPEFLNAVAVVKTELSAQDLLTELHAIEKLCGRSRVDEVRWGPRTLDLDLLFLGEEIINSPALKLPHPEIASRSFVLIPLAEVSPDLIHPVSKISVTKMLQSLNLGDAKDSLL